MLAKIMLYQRAELNSLVELMYKPQIIFFRQAVQRIFCVFYISKFYLFLEITWNLKLTELEDNAHFQIGENLLHIICLYLKN